MLNVELLGYPVSPSRQGKVVFDPYKVSMVETNTFGQNVIHMDNGQSYAIHPDISVEEILQKIEDGRLSQPR